MFYSWFYTPSEALAQNYQIYFNSPATTNMEIIINFYNYVMLIMIFVLVYVLYIFIRCLWGTVPYKYFEEHETLEYYWTLIPSMLIGMIASPSVLILYHLELNLNPDITIKAIGNQWYWGYEYSEFLNSKKEKVSYTSYMIPETELKLGDFRLIEVDNKLMLPINYNIRTIVSSNDVIHSFALPSMGVKIDAIPGRLNQIFFKPLKPGFFTGGCSEICGANHSYMPITARVVSCDELSKFLNSV